jgi:hypothetical protein
MTVFPSTHPNIIKVANFTLLRSDITYASLATAFGQRLVPHEDTLRRMAIISQGRMDLSKQTDEQRAARERMAQFPDKGEVIHVDKELWVVCHAFVAYDTRGELDVITPSSPWSVWKASYASFPASQVFSSAC